MVHLLKTDNTEWVSSNSNQVSERLPNFLHLYGLIIQKYEGVDDGLTSSLSVGNNLYEKEYWNDVSKVRGLLRAYGRLNDMNPAFKEFENHRNSSGLIEYFENESPVMLFGATDKYYSAVALILTALEKDEEWLHMYGYSPPRNIRSKIDAIGSDDYRLTNVESLW